MMALIKTLRISRHWLLEDHIAESCINELINETAHQSFAGLGGENALRTEHITEVTYR